MISIDAQRYEMDCGKTVGFDLILREKIKCHGMQEVARSIRVGSTTFSQSFPYTYEGKQRFQRIALVSNLNRFESIQISPTVGKLWDFSEHQYTQSGGTVARFSGGWLKFHRKMFDKHSSDIVKNSNCYLVWSWLLAFANYKPSRIIWEGKQRELEPGQLVFGLREISEYWNISKSLVSRWLNYLAETERIRIEVGTRGTLVTIRNWETYQENDESSGTETERERDDNRTLAERNADINEEYYKKERSISSAKIFEASFNKQEIEKYEEALRKVLIHISPSLKRHIPRMICEFQTFEAFKQKVEDLWNSKSVDPEKDPAGFRNYFTVSLLREIGVMGEAS